MNDDRQQIIREFRDLFGDRVSTDNKTLNDHSRDACHHAPRAPDAVVLPHTNKEVARIVTRCAAGRFPLIPFGTGTGVEGGVVAVHGGICVDLSHMNRILHVSIPDAHACVQAGVTRNRLNQHLENMHSGLRFAVDPGADASLGGMTATCASGSSAVGYGTMRENVLGVTVVMPNGQIVQTGGTARKSSAGYDLTRLMVGSEGTLGIITEVTLRLVRVPLAISVGVCAFADVDSAVQTVMQIMTAGIPMAKIELLDEVQIEAVNRYSTLNCKIAPTLFFEFHGSPTSVREQTEHAANIVASNGGEGFQCADDAEGRQRLWQARYDAYYASLAIRPGAVGYVTDVCVPISKLAGCIRRTKQILTNTRIPAPLFGHVGDGNFHVVFPIEPGNETELTEVQQLNERIVQCALELGGTCSGEHGIGLGKIESLQKENESAVAVMASIKACLDPFNIMNPGKVLAYEAGQ